MILLQRKGVLSALVLVSSSAICVNAFSLPALQVRSGRLSPFVPNEYRQTSIAATDGPAEPALKKAPVLNGKMLLPLKVMTAGLKGHEVAAVYAIKNSNYKRGSGDGWEHCEHVGVTKNLDKTLENHLEKHGPKTVAHVRALSFAYPQERAMEEVASAWRKLAKDSGAKMLDESGSSWAESWGSLVDERREELVELMEQSAVFDDDDDDDDDDDEDEDYVISPFEENSGSSSSKGEKLEFNKENVDKVLEEVRPYLISDGGNVSVERVDEETRNIYLVLEGACGSCPSSTVTMQMGIERVLKENFDRIGEVLEIEDPAIAANAPKELTWEAVEDEVNRIKPAIIAMGGKMEIVSVNPIGVVELQFQGSNKVQQGVELAIRDIPFVKHVKFVMGQ